ncbi:MAG TPA: YgiQ family radical SAM protein [Planctomycetes bacterium]|nr:YgiQ family radical SAM protein [Planctomycetota bacterium]
MKTFPRLANGWNPTLGCHDFLPMTPEASLERFGGPPDILFVTGDAYIDHPSFAMAILGRVLEAAGFKVALLPQPDWRSADAFRAYGRPRLMFAVSAGNMDSMINHYTANRLPRSDDAYSPGGVAGARPDRATAVYSQRCREAYPGVPVVIGGVEASLRRLAHFDYWSDTVKPSMLISSKADLLVFGMGERPILEVAEGLARGASPRDLRHLRGVTYLLGKKEDLPPFPPEMRAAGTPKDHTLVLPSYEACREGGVPFAVETRTIHHESNPFNGRRLVQAHGDRRVIQNPPSLPLEQEDMDAIYDLPYRRAPHPAYGTARIPAWEIIKSSITIMRGCFGGCTFCSITAHQGRIVQSRSKASIMAEVDGLRDAPGFTGVVSDLGGPTANMYEMRCSKPEVEAKCRRLSCVHPTICKLLTASHGPLKDVLREVRERPHVKKALIASGIRTDLAQRDPEYVRELAAHHVGGMLKVAPEHASPRVLRMMKKPNIDDFDRFMAVFFEESRKAGKRQGIVPYFIASHPGCDLEAMIELAQYLKRTGLKPDAVQDFIPAPMDLASAMYHTGLDPITLKPIPVAKKLRDRRFQRALLQFFKPENWFEVREALKAAGRMDLVGDTPDALIPSRAPRAALERRRKRAQRDVGDAKSRSSGYRPHRKGFTKQGRSDRKSR